MKSDLNTFDDIKDEYIKAYNRLVITFNLTSDDRKPEAANYLSQFTDKDRMNIAVVTTDIKVNGFSKVKKYIHQKIAEQGNLIDDYEGAVA